MWWPPRNLLTIDSRQNTRASYPQSAFETHRRDRYIIWESVWLLRRPQHHGYDIYCQTAAGEVSGATVQAVRCLCWSHEGIRFGGQNRTALWEILLKVGCPTDFVTIICSFHHHPLLPWRHAGKCHWERWSISQLWSDKWHKARLWLGPLANRHYLLDDATSSLPGLQLRYSISYHTDGDLFDLIRLQAVTKVQTAIMFDLLFADDCALVAHTTTALQTLFTQFIDTAKRLKKTGDHVLVIPTVTSFNSHSNGWWVATDSCQQVLLSGQLPPNTISVDIDINSRLAKAGDAFGKPLRRLWGEHSVALLTKIAVYQAAVLSTLLYGCESWVLYRRSVRRLDEFHMWCLCKIAGIKRQDRVSNTEVLCLCGISGIEAFLLAAQLRWVGYPNRSSLDSCRQANAHSVVLLGVTRIQTIPTWRGVVCDTSHWAQLHLIEHSDAPHASRPLRHLESQIAELDRKWAAHKQQVINTTSTAWPCDRRSRTCSSRIGLFAIHHIWR